MAKSCDFLFCEQVIHYTAYRREKKSVVIVEILVQARFRHQRGFVPLLFHFTNSLFPHSVQHRPSKKIIRKIIQLIRA